MHRSATSAVQEGLRLKDTESVFHTSASGIYGAAGTSPFSILFAIANDNNGDTQPHELLNIYNVLRVQAWRIANLHYLRVRSVSGLTLNGTSANTRLNPYDSPLLLDDTNQESFDHLTNAPLVVCLSFTDKGTPDAMRCGVLGAGVSNSVSMSGLASLGDSSDDPTTGYAISLGTGLVAGVESWMGDFGVFTVRSHTISEAAFNALLATGSLGAIVDANAEVHAEFSGENDVEFCACYGPLSNNGGLQIGDNLDATETLVYNRSISDTWIRQPGSGSVNINGTASSFTQIDPYDEYPSIGVGTRVADLGDQEGSLTTPEIAAAGRRTGAIATLLSPATSGLPLRVVGMGNSRNNRVTIDDTYPQTYLFGLALAVGISKLTGVDMVPPGARTISGFSSTIDSTGFDEISSTQYGRFGTSEPSGSDPYVGEVYDLSATNDAVRFLVEPYAGMVATDEILVRAIIVDLPGMADIDVERVHTTSHGGVDVVNVSAGTISSTQTTHLAHAVQAGDTKSTSQLVTTIYGADQGVEADDVCINLTTGEITTVSAVDFTGGTHTFDFDPPFSVAPVTSDALVFGTWAFRSVEVTCPADATNTYRGLRLIRQAGGTANPIIVGKGWWCTNKGGICIAHTGKGGEGYAEVLARGASAIEMLNNLRDLTTFLAPDVFWNTPATQASTTSDSDDYLAYALANVSPTVVLAGDGTQQHQSTIGQNNWDEVGDFNHAWIADPAARGGSVAIDASRGAQIGAMFVDQFLRGYRNDAYHLSQRGNTAIGTEWLRLLALLRAGGAKRSRGRSRARATATGDYL